jgi:para-aminobenzoate synthetase component 2
MILVLDNYDSFTYNLVQYLRTAAEVQVYLNDAIDLDGIAALGPEKIVISPGPKTPNQAGISLDLLRRFAGVIPLLGVCLGHQAIGHIFGARIVRAPQIVHGKTSVVHHDGRTIFAGLSDPFAAMRYHSLVVERDSLPACLEISAVTEDDVIMGLRHRQYPIEGVQFHPESILTPEGEKLLGNFLRI